MAISAIERYRLFRNSREPADRENYTSPFINTGDPDLDSSTTEVKQSFKFAKRVAAMLSDIATEKAVAGAAKINTGVPLAAGTEMDQFYWARDYVGQDAEQAMVKTVDHFDTAFNFNDLFNPALATDDNIRAVLLQHVMPALAAEVANKRR